MTDFNGFNPTDKNLTTGFNTNSQGKKAQQDAAGQSNEPVNLGDPYANLKKSPDEIFGMLNAQARMNIPAGLENPGIYKAMSEFEKSVSPEGYEQMTRSVNDTFAEEFGFTPSANLVENIVADLLVGRPIIQPS